LVESYSSKGSSRRSQDVPQGVPKTRDLRSSGTVLIVGAGLAGLFLALRLAPRRCLVLSPAPLGEAASSAWAQGGLAAALSPSDSPALHAKDTVLAGSGLVDPTVALLIATEGPQRVLDLIQMGVPFDRSPDGNLSLSLEAAHSRPRVARVAGDLAGRAIMGALVGAVRAADHIEVIEGVRAAKLLTDRNGAVIGVLARNTSDSLLQWLATETVLCAGGSGGLFRVTTNPIEAQADALGMALQARALIADPEFVQFHPTAIDVGRDPAPLATEALRGEGASLLGHDGAPFMHRYHLDGELAPRDVVARAIASEIRAGRGAFLDCRQAVGAHFPELFPTVFAACMQANIDPRISPIPVAPAAHYHMGGIVCDMWGRTSLVGLSACGECASTGAHGANRLASNSLLEAVVFADRIATRLRESDAGAVPSLADEQRSGPLDLPPRLPKPVLQDLRARMSLHCGVVRDGAGLVSLLQWLNETHAQHGACLPLIGCQAMVQSALARCESRGGHYRSDYPDAGVPVRTFLNRDGMLSAGFAPPSAQVAQGEPSFAI